MTWSYEKDRHAARAVRISVLGAAQRNPQLAKAINDINRQFLASVAKLGEGSAEAQLGAKRVRPSCNGLLAARTNSWPCCCGNGRMQY